MSYRPCEPDQVMLLPAAPQEWLPSDHLAYFIHDTVDAMQGLLLWGRWILEGYWKASKYPVEAL